MRARVCVHVCEWVGVYVLPSCHSVFCLACYPFFLTASESRLQFYCPKCTCPGRVMLMHCTLLKELAIYIQARLVAFQCMP